MTLFLCGDVMTGRGIDQILPHPGDPQIHEPYVTSAIHYVRLAEAANGPVAAPAPYSYIWGDALAVLDAARPDARIVNLETSITRSGEAWPKGINYRMNPANVPCFAAARIDCCCLANNHVLDYGYSGLRETIETLRQARIAFAGIGENEAEARAPAIIAPAGRGRVIVFSAGCESSGIPASWAAGPERAGVNFLRDLSAKTADEITAWAGALRRAGDVVVVSLHWGENWGYRIEDEQRAFAHRLIDSGLVDLIHGHSSHHPRPIEVHRGKLVLYGCGDFINDYEGIEGYERFRDDLVLAYLAGLDPGTGQLRRLRLVPFRIKNLRLNRPSMADAAWLQEVLDRESRRFGARFDIAADGVLNLSWR